ncbi:glycosyltransferase [Microbacterium sp. 4R-513]|nr:glycosyltransferase [Microbacterium sp. 4R-513]
MIPALDSAPWLPSTLTALADAIRTASADVEVILVDDGSTDGTADVARSLGAELLDSVHVIEQANRGRFLARWAGIERARSRYVLLLDSRVLIDRSAIRYALSRLAERGHPVAWNAYVPTDPAAPLVGLFWEVPTHVFWGRFLRAPKPFDLTTETFDRAPKGTTMFLADKQVLQEAFRHAWPKGDARFVSDDTKVLRWLAETHGIRLDPAFAATYRPRTSLRAFIKHTFDRGTLFVDSYAGTSILRSVIILGLAVLPVVILGALVWLVASGLALVAVAVVALLCVVALVPLLLAAINRCPPRGLLAYVVCLPVFVLPFWLGLLRGVVIHRKSFLRRSTRELE